MGSFFSTFDLCHSLQDESSLDTYCLGTTEPVHSLCVSASKRGGAVKAWSPLTLAWIYLPDIKNHCPPAWPHPSGIPGNLKCPTSYEVLFSGKVWGLGEGLSLGNFGRNTREDFQNSQVNDESSCSGKGAGRSKIMQTVVHSFILMYHLTSASAFH